MRCWLLVTLKARQLHPLAWDTGPGSPEPPRGSRPPVPAGPVPQPPGAATCEGKSHPGSCVSCPGPSAEAPDVVDWMWSNSFAPSVSLEQESRDCWDLTGCPVVRALCFYCRGCGFSPCWGIKILCMPHGTAKRKRNILIFL